MTPFSPSILQQLKTSGKPFLIDFWAEWCGPCKVMTPILEEKIKPHFPGVDFYGVDIEDDSEENQALYQELVSKFRVQGIPTMKLLNFNADGELNTIETFVGVQPEQNMKIAMETALVKSGFDNVTT